MIKTRDEILLLNHACSMVDAAYEELYRAMKLGMRENECVGLVNKVLYDAGSEFVEGVNAISGERCNPHPHVIKPGATTGEVVSVWPQAQDFGFADEEAAFALHAEDLVIAGKPYYTVGGSLPLEREVTSERNTVLDHDSHEAAPANGKPTGDVGARLPLA
ncbi:MAG TPA: hypothetical protein VEF89_04245 [Solirubrobacteraceae bacterium]|nr:hypothetical protein [Solirubrobacteraceae bacterium]